MSYDSKCYELAEAFLDEEPGATEKHKDALAELIQKTIEDFIEFDVRKETARG